MLAVLVGLLVLLNLYLLQSPIDTSPIPLAAGKIEAPNRSASDLATALDNKSAAQFRETVGRPLFNPSRKPVQQDSAGKDSQPEAVDMRLVGVMKSGDGPPRALIRFGGEQTGKWLAEGEEHNGWRLRKVEARSAVVEGGGRSLELTLSSGRRAPEEASGGSEPNR